MKHRFVAGLLVLMTLMSNPVLANIPTKNTELQTAEVNSSNTSTTITPAGSLEMLNYMTVTTQNINDSASSKLVLDTTYDALYENMNLNAIDPETKSQVLTLFNTINRYQSIETKRQHIQYVYEQNQAAAIRSALPNPMSVLNVVQSGNPVKALVSVAYMVAGSVDSYQSYKNEIDMQLMEQNWDLDEQAKESLDDCCSDTFEYMVDMCQKNGLDGTFALNKSAAQDFAKWEKESNETRKLEFFEKNQKTYQAYGKYWLVLAKCYFDKGDYQKCLDAITSYENLNINIFRYDRDYAQAMTLALVSAEETLTGYQYQSKAEAYLEGITSNIERDKDWALRYIAAQGYMNLYSATNDSKYLQIAYDLALENVNYLMDEQYAQNKEYFKTLDEKKLQIPKTDTKAEKKEKKEYNEWVKDAHEVALPPVYQPLMENCELLFGLADALKISESEKTKINDMLHSGNVPLFLVKPLENKYWFGKDITTDKPTIDFDGSNLNIPAEYLSQGSTIMVTVTSNGKDTVYDDWKIDKVDRGKKDKGTIDTFTAKYESKKIKKQKYTNGDMVTIEIMPSEENAYGTLSYTLKANITKKAKVISSTSFEMVD